jgi:hypothetical protein
MKTGPGSRPWPIRESFREHDILVNLSFSVDFEIILRSREYQQKKMVNSSQFGVLISSVFSEAEIPAPFVTNDIEGRCHGLAYA